jgi:putative membrane protein
MRTWVLRWLIARAYTEAGNKVILRRLDLDQGRPPAHILGYAQQPKDRAMKQLGSALLAAASAVAASPAFAQATSNAPAPPDGPPYGYGPMWGYHHMGGWVFHPFGSVLFAVFCVFLVVWAIRMVRFGGYRGYARFRHAGYGHGSTALDILEERFARGEVDKNEFEEKRKLLMR